MQEVEVLRQQVSNYEKDKLTLQLTKQRLLQAEKQFKNLEWEKEVLQQRFVKIEKERDELYARFESSIFELQQKLGLKGMLLERKVEAMHEQLEKKEAQLAEVLAASNLDPQTLQQVRNIVCSGCPSAEISIRSPRKLSILLISKHLFLDQQLAEVLAASNLNPQTLQQVRGIVRSASFLAEISIRSPGNFFNFIVSKNCFWIRESIKKHFI